MTQLINDKNILQYLIDNKIIDANNILYSNFEINYYHSKNYNIALLLKNGQSLFIKKGEKLLSPKTIQNETNYYNILQNHRKSIPLPNLVHHDSNCAILVLDYINPGEVFTTFARSSNINSLVYQCSKLSTILCELHAGVAVPSTLKSNNLVEDIPWIFKIHKPDKYIFTFSSPATIELTKMIQAQSKLIDRINYSTQHWIINSHIHNDIKLSNLIFNTNNQKTYLIDWELANLGDKHWDIACVFAALINNWISSNQGKQRTFKSKFSLVNAQYCINAFWNNYSNKDSNLSLYKISIYSGFRIMQYGFEEAENKNRLNNTIKNQLQVAINIFHDPMKAIKTLFNIT